MKGRWERWLRARRDRVDRERRRRQAERNRRWRDVWRPAATPAPPAASALDVLVILSRPRVCARRVNVADLVRDWYDQAEATAFAYLATVGWPA